MKNIGKKAKRNPWRNTRKDFNMPWNDITASMVMILLPLALFLASFNITIRSESFYSFYFTKSAIANEIPYEIGGDDLSKHFGDFMKHTKSSFQIKEKSEYEPQSVFTKRAEGVMEKVRFGADISLAVTLVLFIVVGTMIAYLYREKENHLIYDSFESSVLWYLAILVIFSLTIFVKYIRTLVFRQLFGVRFEAGDVLIQIVKSSFPIYFGITIILISLIFMIITFYFVNRFVSYRRIFKRFS